MPYTPILATLGYILSPDGGKVLLIHRNRRPNDPHLGKYNGLGGKLDPGEDVVACLRREIREEAGLECDTLVLRGTIFRIDRWSGQPRSENPEGTLDWVDVKRVLDLPLWEGDRHFLPLVFERTERQFHGVMPYRDGRPVSWSYSLI